MMRCQRHMAVEMMTDLIIALKHSDIFVTIEPCNLGSPWLNALISIDVSKVVRENDLCTILVLGDMTQQKRKIGIVIALKALGKPIFDGLLLFFLQVSNPFVDCVLRDKTQEESLFLLSDAEDSAKCLQLDRVVPLRVHKNYPVGASEIQRDAVTFK